MNKARRHELKMLHYRRRVKRYRTHHVLRSTGTPCSCFKCRGEKYRDRERATAMVNKAKQIEE